MAQTIMIVVLFVAAALVVTTTTTGYKQQEDINNNNNNELIIGYYNDARGLQVPIRGQLAVLLLKAIRKWQTRMSNQHVNDNYLIL